MDPQMRRKANRSWALGSSRKIDVAPISHGSTPGRAIAFGYRLRVPGDRLGDIWIIRVGPGARRGGRSDSPKSQHHGAPAALSASA